MGSETRGHRPPPIFFNLIQPNPIHQGVTGFPNPRQVGRPASRSQRRMSSTRLEAGFARGLAEMSAEDPVELRERLKT